MWKLFKNLTPARQEKLVKDAAVAFIDASTMYGAARWYNSLHDDPNWKYAKQYKAAEDRMLFIELMHDLLLYDRITLDCTSVELMNAELSNLFEAINSSTANENLVDYDRIAPEVDLKDVVNKVCQLVAHAAKDSDGRQTLLSIPIPWYYHQRTHFDRTQFERFAKNWELDEDSLPITIFMYRGICYSGYSASYTQRRRRPSVYLASPGRLAALSPFLDEKAIGLLKYPQQAYQDLVHLLDLPPRGYSFSHLPFSDVSNLAGKMYEMEPKDALTMVGKLRSSEEGKEVRRRWADRIWTSSANCCVGNAYSNAVSNSTVLGNVYQTVTIASAN